MPAKAGDAGDDGLVGQRIKRRGIREDFEHFADAEVVAAAYFDIREILPDGREMGALGPLQIAEFLLHHSQRIHHGFRSVADGADAADEAVDAIRIPTRQARKLSERIVGEVFRPIVEILRAVRDEVVIWHISGVFGLRNGGRAYRSGAFLSPVSP